MKILMVSYKYFPRPFANSICLQNIAESFKEHGSSVDFLVYEDSGIETPEKYHGIDVYTITPNLQTRLFYYAVNYPNGIKARIARAIASVISKMKKMAFLYWFPFDSYVFPKRICRKIEDLYSLNKYDLVISAYAPFDIVLAGMWFKQKHPECKWSVYALDSFVNLRQSYIPERMRSARFWIPKFLETADLFIYMKSRKSWFTSDSYSQWQDKLYPSDIPLMVDRETLFCSKPSSDDVKKSTWIYAGSLTKPHYKTDNLMEIFFSLPDRKKRELHFYSSGAEFEELKRRYSKESNVFFHDYIDHDDLVEVYRKANVLISLKSSDQISAKIFEYMAYKKPVLHLSDCTSDPDRSYIEQYPLGLVISTDKDQAKNHVTQIVEWEQIVGSIAEDDFDQSLFSMNTPEYTRDLIISKLELGE